MRTIQIFRRASTSWRMTLSEENTGIVHQTSQSSEPLLLVIYDIVEEEIVQEVIFLVRGVVFEDDSQLDPKRKALWTPNDMDKAKSKEFKSFVESVGAKAPDEARLGFASIKDIHPAFEYRDSLAKFRRSFGWVRFRIRALLLNDSIAHIIVPRPRYLGKHGT
ncbi:hypothetical protein DXG03_007630 [Asterophora parasitica]|uniref:Uncharacterized protein n=1 Tax=Asterophora parasitica TaxID=117018 RepID=A0A9P7G9U8_9AGAR|nr:hypothetical protein DXG03_007630 [Asterophora parasitica]